MLADRFQALVRPICGGNANVDMVALRPRSGIFSPLLKHNINSELKFNAIKLT